MGTQTLILIETGLVAAGQLICCALMAGLFALAGKLDAGVILGIMVGCSIAVLNHFIMVFYADIAAHKARQQNVKFGQALIQISYMGRMIGLFVILSLCAKSGFFNLLTLVLPLTFNGPILTIAELFHKERRQSQ